MRKLYYIVQKDCLGICLHLSQYVSIVDTSSTKEVAQITCKKTSHTFIYRPATDGCSCFLVCFSDTYRFRNSFELCLVTS